VYQFTEAKKNTDTKRIFVYIVINPVSGRDMYHQKSRLIHILPPSMKFGYF